MKPRFFLLVTIGLFIGATCVSLKWGAGVTPDSCGYLSAAESFPATGSFMQYNNTVMTNWPVLYPFLLSLSAFIYTPALHWALLLPNGSKRYLLPAAQTKTNGHQ